MRYDHDGHRRQGFTLVELLIVIAVIAALIGLTVAVGSRVISGGKKDFTRATLETLHSALSEYKSDRRQIPPPFVRSPENADHLLLAADVYVEASMEVWPSMAVAFLALQESSSARTVLEQLPGEVITTQTVPTPADAIALTSVNDGWGNPIRFVHPAFDGHWESYLADKAINNSMEESIRQLEGGEEFVPNPSDGLRRETEVGDADGGLCSGSPYFYSAGPDGDPGTVEDNVYVVEPRIQPHGN